MARRSGRTSDDGDYNDDEDEDGDEERGYEEYDGAAAKAVRAPPQPPAAFPMPIVTEAVVLAGPPLSCHRLPLPVNY